MPAANPRDSGISMEDGRASLQSRKSFSTLAAVEGASERWYHVKKKAPWLFSVPKAIVESSVFVVITTLLTIYALTGDDIRLVFTQKPADVVFDGITWTAFIVFAVEIILSTMGKDDYFLSFFFILDAISTGTLVLDLSSVSESMQPEEEDPSDLQGPRSSRIARLARVVRVLRLVRIIKLYKAIITARQARLRRQQRGVGPGVDDDDEWEDEEIELKRAQQQSESRVSRKLSELTTRRVICLVLLMMSIVPLLGLDADTKYQTSAVYGADSVREAWERFEIRPNSTGYRGIYDKTLLTYIYFHNWFNQMNEACPFGRSCSGDYLSSLFWLGIVSTSKSLAVSQAVLVKPSAAAVAQFEQKAEYRATNSQGNSFMYNFGAMPQQAQTDLSTRWDLECPYLSKSGLMYRVGMSLLREEMGDTVTYAAKCPEDLRKSERQWWGPALHHNPESEWRFTIYFDKRPFVKNESIFNLLTTLFVCLALTAVSLFFSSDANRLVLNPVENMISKVDTFRKDPLAAMRVADEEFKVEEAQKVKQKRQEENRLNRVMDILSCRSKNTGGGEIMETLILEKTIIKLGSLLALGFGEAGAGIISHNLRGSDAAVVVMVEGTKVECIIGSSRIRDFSIATEVLQAQVMAFVNQIAEIVHGVVTEYHGAPNKNSGDAFLTIWRTSDKSPSRVSKMADMAVLAFVTILGAVHRSPVLAHYRKHPGLQQKIGKNCRVNLQSGLHYGWAIEGAVGSEFKIDASYLSPNVSIAETVERATQVYGVSILAAESVVQVCTSAVAAKFRLIDRVVMTGSKDPMEIFVIDLDFMSLMIEHQAPLQVSWTSRQRFRVRQYLEAEKAKKWHEDVLMVNHFNENPDIAGMRFRYTLEFVHVFAMGYQNYVQGEWQVAQRLLSRTRTMLGVEDGPSIALLQYMEGHKFIAPDNWEGVRYLDPVSGPETFPGRCDGLGWPSAKEMGVC